MYLVVGAGGFLGTYVVETILSKTDENIIAVVHNRDSIFSSPRVTSFFGDVRDISFLSQVKSACKEIENLNVIYLAAWHNIDSVAKEPDEAFSVNVTALKSWLEDFKESRRFFFSSSDVVYGDKENYSFRESDEYNPISIYAKQKIEGEKLVLSFGKQVLRLPFMIGPSHCKNKLHFYDRICDSLKSKTDIHMYKNSIRSTLSFKKVAEIIVSLCQKEEQIPNILNVACDEPLSKYDVALKIAEKNGFDFTNIIASTDEGNYIPGAMRAKTTAMDNSLLKNTLSIAKIDFQVE